MQVPRRKTLLIVAGALLLVALTANLWVEALADAVIGQVVIPLARLIVGIFT
jgi:hypothetical protein